MSLLKPRATSQNRAYDLSRRLAVDAPLWLILAMIIFAAALSVVTGPTADCPIVDNDPVCAQ